MATSITDLADESVVQLEVSSPSPQPAVDDSAAYLRQMVNEHYSFVWRSLRRLGVPASDAEDVAQEVFVSAAKRVASIRRGSERGFLYRTAFHHAAHLHRSRKRRREASEELLDHVPAGDPSPEDQVDRERARLRFYQALDELDLELRAVFVLYELDGFTMAEIAQLLEIPAGTVASRLRRARSCFVTAANARRLGEADR